RCVKVNDDDKSRVLWALDNFNEVGVMGVGVSGKTTFSFVLGYKFLEENYQVLYLNFNEKDDFSKIKDILGVIDNYQNKKLLIILDNVHLFKHSLDLYQELRKKSSREFKVIYVGRKVYALYDDEVNFFKTYISVIKGQFVHLKYDIPRFVNIYNYFKTKYNQKVTPHNGVFEIWSNIFQNEIRIFAWALLDFFNKNNSLPTRVPELNSKYVSTIIKKEYLSKAGDNIDRFLDLCKIAQLDLFAPVKLFNLKNPDSQIFTNFKEEGIVYQFYDRKNERQIGMLSPRLAKLILNVHYEGDKSPVENKQRELNEFVEVIKKVPEIAPAILKQIKRYKNLDIPFILKEIYKDDIFVKAICNSGRCLTYSQLLDAEEYYPNFRVSFLNIVKENPQSLLSFISEFQLADLMNFVKYIYVADVKLAEQILNLIKDKFGSVLLQKCPKTSLHELANFLDFLDKKGEVSKKISKYLRKNITDKNNEFNIFEACLSEKTDLEYLSSFLDYIKDKNQPFFNEIIQSISDKSYINTLVKRALKTFKDNPQFLINFFRWFKKHNLPTTQELMVRFVEEHKKDIIDKLSGSSSIYSTSFLTYLANEGINVTEISDKIIKPDIESVTIISGLQKKMEFLQKDLIKSDTLRNSLVQSNFNKLIDLILQSPLNLVIPFFRYLNKSGKENKVILKEVIKNLSQKNIKKVILKIVDSPYDQFKSFIASLYNLEDGGQDFADGILSRFSNDDIRKLINKNIYHDFSKIKALDYVFQKNDKLAKIFFTVISESFYLKRAINQCFRHKDLGNFTNTLKYLDNLSDESKKFSNLLKDQLKTDEYSRMLIEKSFKCNSDRLTNFLKYLDDTDKELLNQIISEIFSDKYSAHLKDACVKTPPYQIVAFLRFLEDKDKEKRDIILEFLFGPSSRYLNWFKRLNEPLLTNFYWYIEDNFPEYNCSLNKFIKENSLSIPERKIDRTSLIIEAKNQLKDRTK
ncbi:MAG: AAA family ATPase, partial [Nanoarchaeota archaeon]|nr:AAA family ATPase [Nanoarchaeota archaeon]